MNATADICLRYLDGDLTTQESEDFDRLIAESPEAALELARCLIDEQYFTKTQATGSSSHIVASNINASDASALSMAVRHLERHEEPDQVLRELLRMEREAVTLQRTVEPPPERPRNYSAAPMSWGQVANATGCLFTQAARSMAARWLAAAVVLLGVTILIALSIGTNDDANTDSTFTLGSDEATPPRSSEIVVAALTATNDAHWEDGLDLLVPAQGDALMAGQRLTLLRGTAQITTNRGAIANVQGPCTIQMLEGGNSLRLIHGRLVGICETESSKGFLVRTPHMDIVDLGTRFGVDVIQTSATEVHVFRGEVKVALPTEDIDDSEYVVTAGQAVVADQNGQAIVEAAKDIERFATLDRPSLISNRPFTQIEGVRSIVGDLQFASTDQFIGKAPEHWPTGSSAVIFHDFIGRLNSDAKINVVDSGLHKEIPKDTFATLLAGTDLRSYIIFKNGNTDSSTSVVTGSITFENEVVGIITGEVAELSFVEAIRATSAVFTPSVGSGAWIESHSFREYIELSEDRRTVSFSFQTKESSDTIRVLVRANPSIRQDESNFKTQ